MATFASLTAEEKQIIRAHMTMVRVKQGQLARLLNDIVALNTVYSTTVSAIVTTLDAGEKIGDNSDLAGAIAVTKEDLVGVMSGYVTLVTGHNTTAKRTTMTSFAGIPNVLGTI